MKTIVKFDKPLKHLNPKQASKWRAWLILHGLDQLGIKETSDLIWDPKKQTITLTRLVDDGKGKIARKDTIKMSGPLLPFPDGYTITETK